MQRASLIPLAAALASACLGCGTEPGTSTVVPTRLAQTEACPFYLGDGSDALHWTRYSASNGDFPGVGLPAPLSCSGKDASFSAPVDDCCGGWHYVDCTCRATEDGELAWHCGRIAWDGACWEPAALPELAPGDHGKGYGLVISSDLAGYDRPDPPPGREQLAGRCPTDRYDVELPASGCWDGAWYEDCVCAHFGNLYEGHVWACATRRVEPNCPPAE